MKRRDFLKLASLAPLAFAMNDLHDLRKVTSALPTSGRMPLLFLGHGSPMNAIEENTFVTKFREVGKDLPAPKAILCISAHWFTKGTKVAVAESPETIYDFSGFPKELYEVKYPAKGSPAFAKETQQLLLPTEAVLDERWGLDHGAWSVLKHLYPTAQIPVFQMSIDYTKPANYHYELAKQLISLREKGVLIVGSGNIIHNLRLVDFANINKTNYGYDWAIEARAKINESLLNGDYKPLLSYEKQGTAWQLAIPTPDHYLPLLYILGLQAKGESISLFNDELVAGSLSMTSVKIA